MADANVYVGVNGAALHAARHATGEADELEPGDIGAATAAQGTLADSATQPGDLATVATSGDYDDLSDKPTIPSASVNTVGATGSTETLAFATDPTSIVHDMTMDEDCEFSFSSAPGSGNAGSMTVIVRGAFTPTWPGSVDWPGGTEPTYAAPSVYEFLTVDAATTVLGFQAGAEMS